MPSSSNRDEINEEDQRINEEYKVWKKNAPFLYDTVLTHALDWPSLTVQWLPEKLVVSGGNYAEHKVILGTHTSDNEPNHLCVAIVRLPTDETLIDARKYDDEKGELGGYGGTSANVEVTIWMNHEGEVNRARYCPQNPFLIGTKTPGGDVLVYDYSKHPTRPASGEKLARPQVRCKGHDDEGYGLAWNPLQAGHLLSGSDDRNVCVWDVNVGGSKTSSSSVPTGNGIGTSAAVTTTSSSSSSSHSAAELQPMYKIANAHSETIEDVAWHCFHKDLFGTVGDDKLLQIWDIREAATTGPRMKNIAHDGDVMSLSFNPFAEYLVLTGGTDKIVKLWDTRSLKSPVHSLVSHEDDVLGVQWSPFNEGLCASSSADRRIMIWDLSKIGQEQNEEDAEDGPPELLFIHGGHTAKISDFSWCEKENWFIASVAEDNILQIWQVAEDIYNPGEEEEEENTTTGESNGAENSNTGGTQGSDKGNSKKSRIADEDLE